ncbi:MAG: CvpA family protein [Rhodoferax sp.]|jgi:membrane protein required for colicin V production|nr:CvpA family protein [Rhodoferax sp.]
MADLDWIFGALLALSTVLGVLRGLVKEVFSLLTWIAAFVLAQRLAPHVAQWVNASGLSETLRYAAGFVIAFVGTLLVGSLLTMAIKGVLTAAGLRPMDRLLGAAFGAARGAVLLLAVTVVVSMTPLRTSETWLAARGPQISQAALSGLKPLLPSEFARFLP